jgi:hypothetical protein
LYTEQAVEQLVAEQLVVEEFVYQRLVAEHPTVGQAAGC